MKKVLLGLICLLSLASCKKGTITAEYEYGVVYENTAPGSVTDPEIRGAYETLLNDLYNDLSNLISGPGPRKVVGKEVDSKDLRSEDESRIAEYESYLPGLQEIEASYRKRIEGIEKRDGVSFSIKGQYLLVRGRFTDINSLLLKEYSFELKYN